MSSSAFDSKLGESSNLDSPQFPRGVPAPATNLERLERNTTIYLQDDCLQHRYIRSRDISGIVERPERLRAIKVGLAAAIARIEEATTGSAVPKPPPEDADDVLAAALGRLDITGGASENRIPSIAITRTTATVDLLKNAAVKYVHGDIDRDIYLENLVAWCRDSQINISKTGTEIPDGFPPLDLYLCPGSIDAIQGAIGAVCEAVDDVVVSTRSFDLKGDEHPQRAFVAVRPPGHHCGEDSPSGFCFVNNVAIGAAHAHLKHGIKRIVILDIDLHHGNGTQSIVWQINEETYRQTLESEQTPDDPPKTRGPEIYYGSIHDILSYPCEDGKFGLVQAASTSLHGAHGQHIENIHLQTYDSDGHFWDVLYRDRYSKLLSKAEDFLKSTGGPGDDVIIFISCGFDACEHEYASMSRHNRKVPTSFYHRFTRDTCILADHYASGRVISVLEGGYSDRALSSGAMAHLCGLVDAGKLGAEVDESWWDIENLVKLEKATKPRKGGRQSLTNSTEPWLTRASALLPLLNVDVAQSPLSPRNCWVPPTSMTLRERKKPASQTSTGTSTPSVSPEVKKKTNSGTKGEKISGNLSESTTSSSLTESSSEDTEPTVISNETRQLHSEAKKLPRVILHVRPPTNPS
ncbi:histone deacetylase domain-containing protein [Hygrophoropsis aurantiaca]|uniref:Histone deacetylase domain-containing protein n=1 Tax=Hygrophoropsis aurantiaca TaxID=72124 RepID=A0ACB8APL9_9AGAM|nr:histone deacetylase domain-containing protein [Hygrophoropsis aurantiaca]